VLVKASFEIRHILPIKGAENGAFY